MKKVKLGVFGFLILGRFAVMVPVTHYKLKRQGYNTVLKQLSTRTLKRWLPSTSSDHRILHASRLAIRIIESRSPFPGTCLSRSLVLWSTLQRYGITAALKIGTRLIEGQPADAHSAFSAHAWVEVQGIPVNATLDVTAMYTPFNLDITKYNIDQLPFVA